MLLSSQGSFKAGQIMWSLQHLQEITSDPTILQCVKGVKIYFKPGVIPFQANVRPSTFNQSQHDIVTVETNKLRLKGVLKVSSPEPGEFVSPIFLRPKSDGSHCMILNLKPINEFVQYHHFKMDTLVSAIRMMKPGCYMASIDLRDASYSVPVAKEHQKYLKFMFNRTLSSTPACQMICPVPHVYFLNCLNQFMLPRIP